MTNRHTLTSVTKLKIAGIAILATLLFIPPMIIRPLFHPDEGRYGEVAREALTDGYWFIPHINQVPHLTKPFLYYAAAAVSMSVFGINAFGLRAVSLMCFLLYLIFAAIWTSKKAGGGAGVTAAIVISTMLLPVGGAQFGDLNTMLTCFVTVGLLLIYNGLENQSRLGSWYAGWVIFGLAFLVKGPVALIFLIGTVLIFRISGGRIKGPGLLHWFLGIVIFSAVALPWYVWLMVKMDGVFDFWMGDMFNRTALSHSEKKPFYYMLFYVPVFFLGTSLWGVFYVVGSGAAVRARAGGLFMKKAPGAAWKTFRSLPETERYLLACVFATIIFFAVIRAKMMSYILPCLPAFGIAVALWLERWKSAYESAARAKIIRIATILSAGIVIVCSWGSALLFSASALKPNVMPAAATRFVQRNIIGSAIAERRDDQFAFYQINRFIPLFNFAGRRNSILVDESIYDEWPASDELEIIGILFLRDIRAGRPMIFVIDKKDMEDYFPLGLHDGLKVICESESQVLISNLH